MAAMADAANVVESALRAKGLLSESPNADEQDLDARIDEEILRAEDIISEHVEPMKGKNPEMASTAPSARSNEGSGSAGAQLNRRNDGEKPNEGMNKVLPSPARAHDPKDRQIKLPPGAAPATGNQHGMEKVALDFIDGSWTPISYGIVLKTVRGLSLLLARHGKIWYPKQQQLTLRPTILRSPSRMGCGLRSFVAIGRGLNGRNLAIPTCPRNVLPREALLVEV